MTNSKDLDYVNELITNSKTNGYPAVYVTWGIIVLIGFVLLEFKQEWANMYWVGSTIVGVLVSIAIGRSSDSSKGQRDIELGKRYSTHFGIMGICIFIAIFAKDYQAILLITGLGYCLAGFYLERVMFLVGIIAIGCYIGVALGIINSSLVLGLVFSSGLFAAAWATSSNNSKS